MAERPTFADPVLELAHRLGGDAGDVYDLATEVTDDQARDALEALDEAEAAEKAVNLATRLRKAGQLW